METSAGLFRGPAPYLHPMPAYTTLSEAVNLPTGSQATCNAGGVPL
jgi:hypothetical protein